MNKSQGLCVQCLPGHDFKAVFHELFVPAKDGSLDDPIPSVCLVAEQGVPCMLHMHPDLVGPSCFQPAFDEGHIMKPFQDRIMGHSLLAMVALRIGGHFFPVSLVTAYMSFNRSLVLFKISPHQRQIATFHGMFEK